MNNTIEVLKVLQKESEKFVIFFKEERRKAKSGGDLDYLLMLVNYYMGRLSGIEMAMEIVENKLESCEETKILIEYIDNLIKHSKWKEELEKFTPD